LYHITLLFQETKSRAGGISSGKVDGRRIVRDSSNDNQFWLRMLRVVVVNSVDNLSRGQDALWRSAELDGSPLSPTKPWEVIVH
jgi:hypothetical protein